ncbi:MAG: hypothetical protein CMIDDMOC_00875 [Sodalis sp. Fle]|nr:MAG: hypothetical protein CMIDDMOC_00875 [Sodalis sp. Fle]
MSVSIGLDGVFYRLFTLLQMWTQVDLKNLFLLLWAGFVFCVDYAIFLKVYLLIILSLYVEFLKEVFLNYFYTTLKY